ncbi:MAG TPA: hypothetical protein VGR38_03475 [Candidatus Polarisedimenticolia bacterium]|nr:hypothetical protein [Candidatus Polarisedimenticolia bacterium]
MKGAAQISLLTLLLASSGFGQQSPPATRPASSQTQPSVGTQDIPKGGMMRMPDMRQGTGMQGMRDGGCSPMCQMMMEKEMRWMPLKVAGLAIFGILLTVALLLLIVLEILWIRLWMSRVKSK